MRHGARTLRVRAALALVATGLAAACESGGTGESLAAPAFAVSQGAAAGQSALMKDVRQATSRFHSLTQAKKAGYAQASECVAVPGLGAMGEHWVNEDLVDPFFDPTAPEALLYEPDGSGNYRLVGLEYIVIATEGQETPEFEGQAFDEGGTPIPVDHWSLHLWLYRTNPAGTFTPFNPDVTCPADEAE